MGGWKGEECHKKSLQPEREREKEKKLPTNGQQEVTTTTNGESLLGERSCKTKKKEGEVKDATAQGLLLVRACVRFRERREQKSAGKGRQKERRERRRDGGRAKEKHVKIKTKEQYNA